MAAYFFASPIDVDVRLEGEDARRQVEVRQANDSSKPDALTKTMRCPVYYDGEGVSGQVAVRVRDGKKVNHDGIKVEFVGAIGECAKLIEWRIAVSDNKSHCRNLTRGIELFYDRGHHHEFLSLSQELAAPGEMRQAQTFEFAFKNVEKQFESYQGINVKLRCVGAALTSIQHSAFFPHVSSTATL